MTPEETVSRNLRFAVSKDLGLASILLYVPAVAATDPDRTAWTDGRKMYFADGYFAYAPEEQVAIAVHEALHVALRHVQRGEAMRLREGPAFDARRWNVACDAIVNHSIGGCRWSKLPAGAWYPENCIDSAKLKERPAELWTAEEIYYEVQNQERQHGKPLKSAGSFGTGDLIGTPGTSVRSGGAHEEGMEQGIWRERLVRAQAGSAPGSVLRRLAADVPKPEVKWESVLRDFLVARLMPLTEATWARPSRRTLAMGREACWIEPGIGRRPGIRRAGVVIDTSGSVDERLLATFLSEINNLIVQTGCEVVLVDCDAQSKLYIADWRHRALLHNTFGIALAEQFFGDLYKRPSDGRLVATRTLAEVHILEDMQAILTPGEFLREMPIRRWMNGLSLEQRREAQSLRIPEDGQRGRAARAGEANHE